jgi:hypothetical protein
MSSINNTLLEEQEQELLVRYLDDRGYKYSAIGHSTFTKSWKVKARNKRMGVKQGVPDLLVIVRNHLLWIELKRVKGGRLSEPQKDWLTALTDCEGVFAVVAKGHREAIQHIEELDRTLAQGGIDVHSVMTA